MASAPDLNIYGGDWWMANQEMERSLVFAGYEVNHDWCDGGHNAKHATQIFPDAMRWLWKDWPAAIKTGLGSPQLQALLVPGEPWQLVAEGYKFTEGPAVNARGEIFFNDVPNSKTYKLGADGKPVVFIADSTRGDGQAFGPDGRLYSVAGGAEKIMAYDTNGKGSVIADGFRGNDLVVRHDGGMYVTNPGWDGKEPSKIWYISPQGEKKVVDTGLKFSNGITLSPDQSLLYVADSRTHWVYSYQVRPDGAAIGEQAARYRHLHMPDTTDDAGARRLARRSAMAESVRGHEAGHSGLRSGRPRELHHSDAQRQGFELFLRRRELRHAVCDLRRPDLRPQVESSGRAVLAVAASR